jgi:hypothetical protein
VERVADIWTERRQANASDPDYRLTISAPTNADARAIGVAIRERRRAIGEVGHDKVTLPAVDQTGVTYELPLAVGDRVRLFASTAAKLRNGKAGNIGRNGSVLDVIAIEAGTITLRNGHGSIGRVRWDTLADRTTGRIKLTYGDALTISSSQGATASEHIDAMPSGSKAVNAFSVYVAESRHRRRSWLVTSDGAERQEIVARRPLGDSRPITLQDVLSNIAHNLSRQPEKTSALAFMEAAGERIRASARGLQRGLRPAEERERAGLERTTMHRTFARNRLRTAAAQLQQLGRRVRSALEAAVTRREGHGHSMRKTIVDETTKDGAYLARLRQRAQQVQQDDREAQQAAQRQVRKQRRGLGM